MKTYFELLIFEKGKWNILNDKIDTLILLKQTMQEAGERGIETGIPKIRFMLQKNEINNI